MVIRRSLALAILTTAVCATACKDSPTAPSTPATLQPRPKAQPVVKPTAPPPSAGTAPHLDVTRVLAFGDSLTEGLATPETVTGGPAPSPESGAARSYPFKLQAELDARYGGQTIHVFNGGVGGKRASEDLDRLATLLDQDTPDVLVILDGANDLKADATIDDTINALSRLVTLGMKHGAKVIVVTLPPENAAGARGSAAPRVPQLNEAIVKKIPGTGATVVDVYPTVTAKQVAPDGLHLIEAGNQIVADDVFEALKKLFEISDP
jgi:lysophospholipase L1-like esterase